MQFVFTLDRKDYLITVERIKVSPSFEWFRLSAGNRSVVVRGDRPLLAARGLKRKRISWKVVEGSVMYPGNLERVLRLLETKLGR